MSSFKIHQPYAPSGDQPEAIAQLVDGLEHGERHQTLLGVTGSGKSVAWDEPVLVRTRHADGFDLQFRAIGPLVDAVFAEGTGRRDQHGTEVGAPRDLEVLSFNSRNGTAEWRRVTAVSRHRPGEMFRVETSCGRRVVVTGDHNFFSSRTGAFRLSRTTDLTSNDSLPIPNAWFGVDQSPEIHFREMDLESHRLAKRNAVYDSGERTSVRTRLSESSTAVELLDAPYESPSALQVRWTPVRSVEPVAYDHPYVYDFSVADNETFLAGHGGIFVHNTYTVAHAIAQWNRPVLVISHNKTLAAQLYGEFKQFFPDNAVGYFISYYDYYQPEAYVPSTNTYIAKDASINDDIDRLRLQATSMLLERNDVIIVASVSCIYGLGTPEDWSGMRLDATAGQRLSRRELLEKLVSIQYTRNDIEVGRGNFRVRGDVVEVHPAYEDSIVRIELDDDVVSRISALDPVTGRVLRPMERLALYPAKHFVTPEPRLQVAIDAIRDEMEERVALFKSEGKLLEAQRIRQRTEYDLEMLSSVGTCAGVENYSRHLSGRKAGDRPGCLIDYFQGEFLLVIDESHVTIPQIGGMYEGDRSRKQTLVDFGFRLPSALDNRPLRFEEFETLTGPALYVSATPADYELRKSKGVIVEQIIRPTGLIDPEIVIKPIENQVDDLLEEIRLRVEKKERVLVTTLTKRMAEDLTDYLAEMGVRVRYLHSDIDALGRVEILRGLRLGDFDVLVGINLLREGLDLPEVSLVAILDADKEGFLRSERSLIQTAGRAARNISGRVILYADKMTDSMRRALDETHRRRQKQMEYNLANDITPQTVVKTIEDVMRSTSVADAIGGERVESVGDLLSAIDSDGPEALIAQLEAEMDDAARKLEFERAASLRDRVEEIRSALAAAEKMGVRGTAGLDEAARRKRHAPAGTAGSAAGRRGRRR